MSSSFQYSSSALAIKSKFHNKRFSVYVEAQDDVAFWNLVFSEVTDDFHIDHVNGKNNLKSYKDIILQGNRNIVVACDRDHSAFDGSEIMHKNIIYTYGYSIENTMYCPQNIRNFLKRLPQEDSSSINFDTDAWYSSFVNDAKQLLIYDICSIKYKKGIECFGDNCCRFQKDLFFSLDVDKINSFVNNIKDNFSDEEYKFVEDMLLKIDKNPRFLLKGHFISHAIIGVIKQYSRNSLNIVALDTALRGCLSRCNPECADREYLRIRVQEILNL